MSLQPRPDAETLAETRNHDAAGPTSGAATSDADTANLDWRARKPKFTKEPRAWFMRKLRLKLSDLASLIGCRVIPDIGFGGLRPHIRARHVIDVGVASGTPDLHRRFPDATLELFEPCPEFFPRIENNVLRGRSGRLHKVALGDVEGTAMLARPGSSSGSLVGGASAGDGAIEVPVRRLDEVLSPADIQRPCLLKVDTEGFEMAALKGATGLMDHIDTIVVELQLRRHDVYKPKDLIDFLSDHGFDLTDILNVHAIEGAIHCCDVVFERRA